MATRFTPETETALNECERQLWSFGERLGHVLSVQAELALVSRGKQFEIRHLGAWNMLLATFDMVVVDLASWALGFYEPDGGGFLRKLRGPDLTALELKWRTGPAEERNEPAREEAFRRLFPGGVTSKDTRGPSQEDVSLLCDRLAAHFKPLHDDRNQHRAHRYEKKQPKTADVLDLGDTAKHLLACQELLGDLRCLSSNSSFDAYRYEPKARKNDDQAQDVVDLILCGDMKMIIDGDPAQDHDESTRFYWQRRTAHYSRLHAAHDALPPPDTRVFNNPLVWVPSLRPSQRRER